MEVYTILFDRLLSETAKRQASDLHLSVGSVPVVRRDGRLQQLEGEKIIERDVLDYFVNTFLDERERGVLAERHELTTVKQLAGNFRFKINIYYQKKLLAASFRLLPAAPRDFSTLQLPEVVGGFTKLTSGLVIIAGPYGSGKTTTVSAVLESMNRAQKRRILTIGQPIEQLFVSKQSIVEQREVGVDTSSFITGLEYCQSEDIDVLAVSDIGAELAIGMPLLLDIASTNSLVFLELPADSATRVIDKILDCFSQTKREAARVLLADVLQAIVVQKLLVKVGGGMALATEVVTATAAVRSVIRQNRIEQLPSIMQTSGDVGMVSLNTSLAKLVQSGQITREEAVAQATDKENFHLMFN